MIPISEDELSARLENKANILRPTIQKNGSYQLQNREGHCGIENKIPREARPLVAAMAMVSGNKATAEVLGISHQRVQELKTGKDRNGVPIPEEVAKVEAIRERLADVAISKTLAALNIITDERLKGLPVQEAVSAAKDLSIVVRNVSGDPGSKAAANAQVIIFSPNQRDRSTYDTIDVEVVPTR